MRNLIASVPSQTLGSESFAKIGKLLNLIHQRAAIICMRALVSLAVTVEELGHSWGHPPLCI